METSLTQITKENGLDQTKAQTILDHFTSFFEEAKSWEIKARTIVITDVSQKAEMKVAREARLALKTIRVNAENARKELKEQSLREGKAIDGIANVIKALIVPIEEHLEAQEKFAEIQEQKRIDDLVASRASQLLEFVPDISPYNLRGMSDEAFVSLIAGMKAAAEAQRAAEEKAEHERIEREKADIAERERIRRENERLRKEAEEREVAISLERKKVEEQQRKERELREKAEAALKAKEEAEERAKKEAEDKLAAETRAKEDAERRAQMQPEKDKLLAYAEIIKSVEAPQGLSKAGQQIVKMAETKLLEISQIVREEIKSL